MKKEKLLKVINYVKTNRRWSGKQYPSGYHSVIIDGEFCKGARDNQKRVDIFKENIDLNGKNVIDIGCNMGGILHKLSNVIKSGIGFDYSYKAINAANAIKSYNKSNNLQFYVFNVDEDDLGMMENFCENIDIVFMLSVSMHIKRFTETIDLCRGLANILVFEANGNKDVQSQHLMYVEKFYNVKRIQKDKMRRNLYICEKRS